MNQILPVWKPTSITSYDIIRKIKSINNSYKIGHCGTLDPFAEGIVIICLGDSTKKSSFYMKKQKTYIAKIKFGEETDTLDLTGKVIKKSLNSIPINKNSIYEVLEKYNGEINQVPPYFSAKKIYNVKMYDLARKDIFIRLKPVTVNINEISLIKFNYPFAEIKISCSKGTYIRAIARDIAYDLNTFGHLQSLQRISIGEFDKKNSIKFDDLEKWKFKN